MSNKFPLQACKLMLRLEVAADKCGINAVQRLSCLYNVLVAPCHPEHLEVLLNAVEVHMKHRNHQYTEYHRDRKHPDLQLSLKDIALWQGKPPFAPSPPSSSLSAAPNHRLL